MLTTKQAEKRIRKHGVEQFCRDAAPFVGRRSVFTWLKDPEAVSKRTSAIIRMQAEQIAKK